MTSKLRRVGLLLLVGAATAGGCAPNATDPASRAPEKDAKAPAAARTADPHPEPLSDQEADAIARQLQTTLPSPLGEEPSDAPSASLEAQSHDVYECAFRYLFDHNFSGLQRNASAFCLKIDGSDPPPELMARFAGHAPPVVPGSKFVLRSKQIQFRIDNLRWQSADQVMLEGGYHAGPLSGAGSTLHLIRENGQWRVIFEMRRFIS